MEGESKGHFEIYGKYYLLGILVLAFAIRLYFFLKYQNQALWWDEADYLSIAKSWALGTPNQAPPWRAWGIAVLYGPIYWLGGGESIIRFIEILFSVGGIYLTYLVGKEFYSKQVGLIAALVMSSYWLHLFWTARISMGVIGLVFWIGAALCFYKGYVQKKTKYLVVSGILIGSGIFIYEAVGFIIPFIALFILTTEKLNFLKNKKFWIFIAVILIAATPFFIRNYIVFDSIYPRIGHQIEDVTPTDDFVPDWQRPIGEVMSDLFIFFTQMPNLLKWGFLILAIIGLSYFFKVILGFDLIWKDKSPKLKKDYFIILWALTQLLIVGTLIATQGYMYEPRLGFPAFPAISVIVGLGAMVLYNSVKKYNKETGIVVIAILLLWGAGAGVAYASDSIEQKSQSFYYEREAGEWLKENTEYGEVVLACSQSVPLLYYSERDAIGFSYQNVSSFDEAREIYDAEYIVFDFYSYACNPDYITDNEDSLELVQAYFLDAEQTQPIILIFRDKA